MMIERELLLLLGVLATLVIHPTASRAQATSPAAAAQPKRLTIFPIGDSITHGNGPFWVYRFPLWEKLHAAGYFVEYVGSNESPSRIGPLKHEGYGGRNAEFLAENIERLYRANPADIVLLHSGHNHSAEENPIPGIVAANEKIVRTVLAINPNAKVLIAQVIPSAKLPKYSYIPRLNQELAQLAVRLDEGKSRVFAVDQAAGFDVEADTVADKVHPSQSGAEKMANRWFEQLVKVLPAPPEVDRLQPQLFTYKKAGNCELKLHVFQPSAARTDQTPRPAIVYFFGGGWTNGTPLQFYADCKRLAAKGMVAISADYRIASVNGTTPFESLADAKSAMRWVRQHAQQLDIDPHRITAAGASAGGHLAAATAMVQGFDDPADDLTVSPRPDALVLHYPVIDNGPDGYGYDAVKEHYKEFSPLYAVDRQAPPTIIFQGTADQTAKLASAQAFQKRLRELGGDCELQLFEGRGHPIYSYREPPTEDCLTIRGQTYAFLTQLGYLGPQHRNRDHPEPLLLRSGH